ncbi:MAG: tetratricopeptide repeat protein [Acidobacteria bacterium]|nr:tetratricopeptide repeat protein [Acidobacteriota bacterium]MBV9474462.1 tetratricopeptide repeat protein [Acidobacteriota bacterium]
MKRTKIELLLAAALAIAMVAARCTTAPAPPPAVNPEAADRYLIDPRTGSSAPIAPPLTSRFDAAWQYVEAGQDAEAVRRLDEILRKNPDFMPAKLALVAIDIRAGRFNDATRALQALPASLVTRVYEAEIAVRQHDTRRAYDLYRAIAGEANAPATARERIAELETAMFNDLFAAAQSAPDTESIRLLREALALNPGATDARILLARKLATQREFDESRAALEPILGSAAVDRAEVQETLAEIDAGRGRYQEAIVRYERLARRTKEPRYTARLDELKEIWSSENMPPQYRQAFESTSLTRAELAVLLYWSVPSVRFAQNLASPPIAVDIADVPGREEIIRAIAIGMYDVDPVTRRVGPFRQLNAGALTRVLGRLLQVRGASCAHGTTADRTLAACGVSDPLLSMAPETPVTGRDARRLLEAIGKLL